MICGVQIENVCPGVNIIDQYEISALFYVVVSGKCEVVQTTSNGEIQSMRTLSSGDIFGEIGLIHDSVRSCTVQALTDVTLYELNKHLFNVRKTFIKGFN